VPVAIALWLAFVAAEGIALSVPLVEERIRSFSPRASR
jgi:hypothetical protein